MPTSFGKNRKYTTLAMLVLGLIAAVLATLFLKARMEKTAEQDFVIVASGIKNNITERLVDHAHILQSGVAFLQAFKFFSREDWRIFIQNQKAVNLLPRIQEIGFSQMIPRKDLNRHLLKIRNEGFPEYTLHPEGVREVYSSIIYLEPFSSRNLHAFGYDMLSEPIRRAAMEQARDTDLVALSGKVALVQETSTDIQADVLMYVPVYRKGMPITTVKERRAAIYGWIYSPYRMQDLIDGIFSEHNLKTEQSIYIQVFDGEQPSPKSLLYDNRHTINPKKMLDVSFTHTISIDFNGHRWTVLLKKTGNVLTTVEFLTIMFIFTCCIFGLERLFFWIRALQDTRTNALQIAEDRSNELRESEEKIRLLLNSTAEAIYGIDVDGNCTFCNNSCLKMLGYKHPDELLGKNMHSKIHGKHADGTLLPIEECLINPEFIKGVGTHLDDEVLWRSNGTFFSAELRSYPQLDNGIIVGAVVTFLDITERRKAAENLRTRQKETEELLVAKKNVEMEANARSAFLANMSHEIRTPMNIILGFSTLMQTEFDLSTKQYNYLSKINRSGEDLLALLEGILEISKIDAGRAILNPKNFDLHTFLHDLKMMFLIRTEAKNLKFDVSIPDNFPRCVFADEVKLKKIILNLLENALKFTAYGGISLRVRSEEERGNTFRLVVEVEDSGIPIGPNELTGLFQFFELAKSGVRSNSSNGIGLAISRQYIRLMCGDLSVSPLENKGNIFRFEVKIQLGKETQKEGQLCFRKVLGLQPGQASISILVVDDLEENRLLLVKMLQKIGFKTVEASNGEKAVIEFEKSRPDLIFMDLHMPITNGYEATKQIRQRPEGKTTPIIAITGSNFLEDHPSLFSTGMSDYVSKPFKEQDILSKIASFLSLHYVYAEENPALVPAEPVLLPHQLSPDALSVFPKELLEKISNATISGERDLLFKLLDESMGINKRVADCLLLLVKEYKYNILLELLRKGSVSL